MLKIEINNKYFIQNKMFWHVECGGGENFGCLGIDDFINYYQWRRWHGAKEGTRRKIFGNLYLIIFTILIAPSGVEESQSLCAVFQLLL